jgi:hypothetical protein
MHIDTTTGSDLELPERVGARFKGVDDAAGKQLSERGNRLADVGSNVEHDRGGNDGQEYGDVGECVHSLRAGAGGLHRRIICC